MLLARIAIVASFLVAAAVATDGGDISEFYDKSAFDCAKGKGWDFVIVRSYCSFGGVDDNAPRTLQAAKDAGIQYRDVYHFPCHGKVSAEDQVKADLDHVGKANFGTMWFDIETNPSPGCGYSGDKDTNCKFLKDLIDAGKKHGVKMGVYASPYMWSSIMGSCTAGADNGLPLWYAHYDYTRSFGDFSAFGGWKHPAMKQYNDAVGICGISADADWY